MKCINLESRAACIKSTTAGTPPTNRLNPEPTTANSLLCPHHTPAYPVRADLSSPSCRNVPGSTATAAAQAAPSSSTPTGWRPAPPRPVPNALAASSLSMSATISAEALSKHSRYGRPHQPATCLYMERMCGWLAGVPAELRAGKWGAKVMGSNKRSTDAHSKTS